MYLRILLNQRKVWITLVQSVAEEIFEGNNYALADGGFVEELEPIVQKVGAEKTLSSFN